MIVEFFGPAGAGKSTLSHALLRRLREHGHVADIVFSNRPGQRDSVWDLGGFRLAVLRVFNAVFDTIALVCHPLANAHVFKRTANLVAILPPRNVIWLIRITVYILRLTQAWRGSTSGRIVIFDQGFIQAVCSLALFNRAADEKSLAHALDLIPEADLVIRLDCPQKLLEARLEDRLRRERFLERLFEVDLRTFLQLPPIVAHVSTLLRTRGRSIVCINSDDPHSLNEILDRIEEEIMAKLDTKPKMAAMERSDAARQ